MNKLSEAIKSYRAWKMKEHGTSNITAKEVKLLRESLNKKTSALKESSTKATRNTRPTRKSTPKSKNVLLERISSYREWKMKEHGINTVNAKEVRLLKESIVAEKVESNVSKKIHEARVSLVKAKRKLREGDMQGAADMTQMAGDNINAAGDMATGTTVQLPDNIITAITNVKTAIDSLATEAGIQSPVDLSGNPDADIPPVDGGVEDPNAPADPNAQAQQPVLESVKARLEAREKRIKENIWDDTQKLQKTLNPDFTQKKPVDTTPSPDTIQIPSTSKLLNGTKDAADTWPTKPISEPSSKKKVKEEEESLTNSWADRHVREALEKNTFNWKDWLDSECNLNKR